MKHTVGHFAGFHSACIGKRRIGEFRIVAAVVAVRHAHSLLHAETAAPFVHFDGDAVALKSQEFLGQADVISSEYCLVSIFPLSVAKIQTFL